MNHRMAKEEGRARAELIALEACKELALLMDGWGTPDRVRRAATLARFALTMR